MIDIINLFIKLLGINTYTCYSYFRIVNSPKLNISKKMFIFSTVLCISLIEVLINDKLPGILRLIIPYITFSLLLGKISSNKIGISYITTTMSISLSYIFTYIAAILVFIITSFVNRNLINPIYTILISIIVFIVVFMLLYFFFKIKKLKNGFSFIKNNSNNEQLDIFVLILNALIIFVFLVLENLHKISFKYLTIGFISLSIILFIILQKSFILFQKLKIKHKALKDYEHELAETKQKLSTALEEKEKLVKSNHEFYHRQEALNKKLNDLIAEQKLLTNTEFGEDIGNLAERINNLSNEYIAKIKMLPKLVKTNVTEIDDMLSYLQAECDKNNIDFILKIECDVNHIIENYISKSQFETLLGDLIRNAIIAINHSDNKFRSIMTVFGIKDDDYEICVLDSGIDFEINTLISLGLTRASTHTDEGGTGIGFITTFETINSCNASLIIDEETNNNYSKSLEIKFDNKNEYVVISKRAEEIKQFNKSNRNIILKG